MPPPKDMEDGEINESSEDEDQNTSIRENTTEILNEEDIKNDTESVVSSTSSRQSKARRRRWYAKQFFRHPNIRTFIPKKRVVLRNTFSTNLNQMVSTSREIAGTKPYPLPPKIKILSENVQSLTAIAEETPFVDIQPSHEESPATPKPRQNRRKKLKNLKPSLLRKMRTYFDRKRGPKLRKKQELDENKKEPIEKSDETDIEQSIEIIELSSSDDESKNEPDNNNAKVASNDNNNNRSGTVTNHSKIMSPEVQTTEPLTFKIKLIPESLNGNAVYQIEPTKKIEKYDLKSKINSSKSNNTKTLQVSSRKNKNNHITEDNNNNNTEKLIFNNNSEMPSLIDAGDENNMTEFDSSLDYRYSNPALSPTTNFLDNPYRDDDEFWRKLYNYSWRFYKTCSEPENIYSEINKPDSIPKQNSINFNSEISNSDKLCLNKDEKFPHKFNKSKNQTITSGINKPQSTISSILEDNNKTTPVINTNFATYILHSIALSNNPLSENPEEASQQNQARPSSNRPDSSTSQPIGEEAKANKRNNETPQTTSSSSISQYHSGILISNNSEIDISPGGTCYMQSRALDERSKADATKDSSQQRPSLRHNRRFPSNISRIDFTPSPVKTLKEHETVQPIVDNQSSVDNNNMASLNPETMKTKKYTLPVRINIPEGIESWMQNPLFLNESNQSSTEINNDVVPNTSNPQPSPFAVPVTNEEHLERSRQYFRRRKLLFSRSPETNETQTASNINYQSTTTLPNTLPVNNTTLPNIYDELANNTTQTIFASPLTDEERGKRRRQYLTIRKLLSKHSSAETKPVKTQAVCNSNTHPLSALENMAPPQNFMPVRPNPECAIHSPTPVSMNINNQHLSTTSASAAKQTEETFVINNNNQKSTFVENTTAQSNVDNSNKTSTRPNPGNTYNQCFPYIRRPNTILVRQASEQEYLMAKTKAANNSQQVAKERQTISAPNNNGPRSTFAENSTAQSRVDDNNERHLPRLIPVNTNNQQVLEDKQQTLATHNNNSSRSAFIENVPAQSIVDYNNKRYVARSYPVNTNNQQVLEAKQQTLATHNNNSSRLAFVENVPAQSIVDYNNKRYVARSYPVNTNNNSSAKRRRIETVTSNQQSTNAVEDTTSPSMMQSHLQAPNSSLPFSPMSYFDNTIPVENQNLLNLPYSNVESTSNPVNTDDHSFASTDRINTRNRVVVGQATEHDYLMSKYNAMTINNQQTSAANERRTLVAHDNNSQRPTFVENAAAQSRNRYRIEKHHSRPIIVNTNKSLTKSRKLERVTSSQQSTNTDNVNYPRVLSCLQISKPSTCFDINRSYPNSAFIPLNLSQRNTNQTQSSSQPDSVSDPNMLDHISTTVPNNRSLEERNQETARASADNQLRLFAHSNNNNKQLYHRRENNPALPGESNNSENTPQFRQLNNNNEENSTVTSNKHCQTNNNFSRSKMPFTNQLMPLDSNNTQQNQSDSRNLKITTSSSSNNPFRRNTQPNQNNQVVPTRSLFGNMNPFSFNTQQSNNQQTGQNTSLTNQLLPFESTNNFSPIPTTSQNDQQTQTAPNLRVQNSDNQPNYQMRGLPQYSVETQRDTGNRQIQDDDTIIIPDVDSPPMSDQNNIEEVPLNSFANMSTVRGVPSTQRTSENNFRPFRQRPFSYQRTDQNQYFDFNDLRPAGRNYFRHSRYYPPNHNRYPTSSFFRRCQNPRLPYSPYFDQPLYDDYWPDTEFEFCQDEGEYDLNLSMLRQLGDPRILNFYEYISTLQMNGNVPPLSLACYHYLLRNGRLQCFRQAFERARRN